MTTLSWDLEYYTGGAWVSIKADALQSVIGQHGFASNNPTDRLATTGTLSYTLNNAINNSGAKQGYYSPGHADCRTGFDLGAVFRLKISDGATTRYQLRSKAKTITPTPGVHADQRTKVFCTDYIDDLSEAPLQQIPIQASKRIDEALTTLIAAMVIQPKHTSFSTGPDVFPRLLTGLQDNKAAIITAIQKLCQTEMSYCFLVGDTTDGETLKWQHRHDRLSAVSSATFSNIMSGCVVQRERSKLMNEIVTVAHPCRVDTTEVILATTDALEFTIEPGATKKVSMTIPFTDPDQLGRRVDMVYGSQPVGWPVANTDYKMGSASGLANLNANLVITPGLGGNSAATIFENTAAVRGYVSLYHIRGKGVYDYTPVEKVNSDAASIAIHNRHPYRYDMPYQPYGKTADDFGKVMLAGAKDPFNYLKSVTFHAHDINNPLFATYAATLDVGMMVTVAETVSGIVGDYFIGSIKWECGPGNTIDVTLGELEPAVGNWPFRICAAGDDVTDPAISILALYPESDTVNFTPTDPYGNPFHRLYV
jgi:hypothetical protein